MRQSVWLGVFRDVLVRQSEAMLKSISLEFPWLSIIKVDFFLKLYAQGRLSRGSAPHSHSRTQADGSTDICQLAASFATWVLYGHRSRGRDLMENLNKLGVNGLTIKQKRQRLDLRGNFLALRVAEVPKMGKSIESPSLELSKHNRDISLYPQNFSKICREDISPK